MSTERNDGWTSLFCGDAFCRACLLFLLQPMVAKMILPLLGGTPAVWNTCMVFFQAALLAAYAYAHAAPTWLGDRRQTLLHLALVALPFLVLPVAIMGWEPAASGNPIPWLLALLAASAGLPFFVVATSAPLLQRWFAGTNDPAAGDPYFLYAASNLGSMTAPSCLSHPRRTGVPPCGPEPPLDGRLCRPGRLDRCLRRVGVASASRTH